MEEKNTRVFAATSELGNLGVPAFLFQESGNPATRHAFSEVAKCTCGACYTFDGSSVQQLSDQPSTATVVYAAGGKSALERFGEGKRGDARQQHACQICPAHDKEE